MQQTFLSIILALCAATPVLSHNYVVCSDAYPNLQGLDVFPGRTKEDWGNDKCKGYPRAFPENLDMTHNYNDQGYPWQGIWPLMDGISFRNHRAVNWLQQDPVYDPARKEAHVKPKSTVLVQVQTNNHAHEWKQRQSGRHLIFLAGKSGTQITTGNQLTWDRLVFSAPTCKYGHIIGDTPDDFGGYDGDAGDTWLPLKLVDPTGAWLPEGTYQFIFAYFWSTGDYIDYMMPDYTSAFDIVISNDATSTGAVPNCDAEDGCHDQLVGKNSSCPAAKTDKTPPWAPFANNGAYLFTNPDGDDPTTPNGKRTFQPYWTEFVEATDAPPIKYQKTIAIESLTEDEREKPLPLAGNVTYPKGPEDVPFVLAGKTLQGKVSTKAGPTELKVTQMYKPMSVSGAGSAGGSPGLTYGGGNSTMGSTGGSTGGSTDGSSGTKPDASHSSSKPSATPSSGGSTAPSAGQIEGENNAAPQTQEKVVTSGDDATKQKLMKLRCTGGYV